MKVLMFLDYYNVGGIEKVIMNIKENIDNHYHIDILSMVNKSNDDVISLLDKDYRKLFLRSLLNISLSIFDIINSNNTILSRIPPFKASFFC